MNFNTNPIPLQYKPNFTGLGLNSIGLGLYNGELSDYDSVPTYVNGEVVLLRYTMSSGRKWWYTALLLYLWILVDLGL